MSRHPALVAVALVAAFAGTARAATQTTTLTGNGLSIDSPCAASVAITPDATLHDQAVIQATADHQEEIDHLWLESRGTARVHTHPGYCWREDANSQPTLVLTIRVPAAAALDIDESGASRYTVGAVGGTLRLDVSGAIEFSDAAATSVQADISGSGNLDVGRADGPASISVSGHGDIILGVVAMPNLAVDLSGAGRVVVEHGQIGQVRLSSSGAGQVRIGADVNDAHVDLSGAGSVHFARVSGRLTKDVSGFGSVTVQ